MLQRLQKILRNKYFIAAIGFFVWLLFFDQNNIIDRWKSMQEINELQEEKQYYLQKIRQDTHKLWSLKTDKEKLERFAREEYFMKKDDEDIFIIKENDNKK